ncbi:hypothetical protein KFK09_021545 [Dendrobium nobile]|uniref:Gnk2-homologous domain-containing protein n=1 Tax=Dendrobium nobile TaxID=94219 RepID=A0A8T3AQE2_DENNO|nr:hypothetical protein KFK09_021539 [Dendrobium nobile]KAI0498304.1 hypothetical protein KFK09_021545 [Dendrobium nobile]
MEFSGKLFIFLLLPLLFLQISTCDAYANPIYHACSKNFTSDNLIQDSINKTLSSLLAKTPLDSFGISSFGDGFFSIYGLSQCRGNLNVDQCARCITKATEEIRTLCPNSAETRIWYDHCFLHYDTTRFFGEPDTSFTRVFSSGLVAADPITFNYKLMDLVYPMNAMAVGIDKKFSVYVTDVSKNLTLLAMAQCTRDLEELACRQCLDKLSEIFSGYCKYHLDCYVISSSCVLRYGVSDFLNASVSLSPLVFAAGSS